jgi:hypothetical protein
LKLNAEEEEEIRIVAEVGRRVTNAIKRRLKNASTK